MNTTITIESKSKQLLSDVLRKSGFSIPMPCGGNGKCGKCIATLNGKKVLACKTYVEGINTVEFDTHKDGKILNDADLCITPSNSEEGLCAAVDLGTTTIAINILDMTTGKVICSLCEWNKQAAFGADVITRIDYINRNNGLNELSSIVRNQVMEMVSGYDIKKYFISGNTIMQHIFAGISPSSIAVVPYTPLTRFNNYKENFNGIEIIYSPCVSGYVGGDITAGILFSEMTKKKENSLFIDIGTNGEMAIGNKDRITTCAVASGPAFEGAEISCGMPGLTGAICQVTWDNDSISYKTIGDAEPIGICGSGLIDLIAVLLENGKITTTGKLLESPYYLSDEVYLTIKDVRKLQLAKAAVRAGISVLMEHEKLSYDDIDTLYISGGFGTYLNIESAAKIDMIPVELKDKVKLLGNSSLKGASYAVLQSEKYEELQKISEQCDYLELSGNALFNKEYIEKMMFGEE